MCLEEDQRVVVPNKIDGRKLAWNIKYKNMANPLTPRKPRNYSTRRTSQDSVEIPHTNDVGSSIVVEDSNDDDNDNGTITNAVNNAGHLTASI